ncbi:hypothetical protein GSU68_12215 [Rathayibacter sp. VKM Ac-2759]|uniref:hypothetical protein n=1 Tax=Rathayibacter sp. VKM Ac-2759 TaxID=2609252 RepID=UPI0013171419|nr:hypothetical protein [Rathayibacter sp. VKM Ac-2759]QHC67253.1 hypothetical protein GSU68_12215 [Rathayibacter sp. VKM Ac-2759]
MAHDTRAAVRPAPPAGPEQRRPRPGRRRVLIELGRTALTAVIATVLGVLALHITPADLAQRWTAGGNDQILHYTIFGSAQDVFPYFPNTQLGFPASQNLLFSPLFDPWSALFVAVVGPFVPNGIWVLNLFYVAGFAGIGATGYLFFRALRVRPSIATVFGVIGAVLPYHFVRIDYGHPFLANYWSVPLIGILVLVVAGPATDPVARLVSGISSTRRRRIVTAALLVALTAGVAWTVSYYYVFGAIILGTTWAVSVVAALIGRRPLRTLAWPTFTLGSLGLLIAVQVGVLSLNFGERYTKYFSGRTPQESEYYGGKLQQLLLPSTTSGFPSLRDLATDYQSETQILTSGENPSTAVIASLSIILVLAVILLRMVAGSSLRRRDTRPGLLRFLDDPRVGALSVAFVFALLFFIVGGFGTMLAYYVSPEIRVWSRMAIVIDFLALGVAAILIDMLAKRLRALVPVLALVSLVAAVDQLAGVESTVPLVPSEDASLRQFTAAMDEQLPVGCGVAQLPFKGFPETGPIGGMGDYDEGLPYVYSTDDDLRFSYGAVRGTEAGDEWNGATTPEGFAEEFRDSGACAILVDTAAYPDDPQAWTSLVGTVTDTTTPALTSDDAAKRYLLFVP